MSKFTAAGLVVFYQKVADGGVMEVVDPRGSWYPCASGPTLMQNNREWRIKPAKKIIDLEPLIASGIDCEFKDADNDTWQIIGPLSCAAGSVKFPYQRKGIEHVAWEQCRPRMNHKMFYNGEKPIEGFVVKVYFGSKSAILTGYRGDAYWANVTAIEYLEVEDGYAYPWEQAE